MKRAATNLILTRPEVGNQRFIAQMDPTILRRLNVVQSPLIRIVAREVELPSGDYRAIFTSQHGVAYGPPGAGRRAYCVGQNTAKSAQLSGWDAVALGQNLHEMTRALGALPPDHFVHFRGVHTVASTAAMLSDTDHKIDDVIVYDQLFVPLSEHALRILELAGPTIVPLFSPRTARYFAQQAGGARNVTLVALSDAVASAAKGADMPVHVAQTPELNAVVALVENLSKSVEAG